MYPSIVAGAALLGLLCVRASMAMELAKCSKLTLTPTMGLCSGSSFTINKCTGGSSAFDYNAAGLASLVTARALKLEQVTDSICYAPFDELCTSYISAKVNFHQSF